MRYKCEKCCSTLSNIKFLALPMQANCGDAISSFPLWAMATFGIPIFLKLLLLLLPQQNFSTDVNTPTFLIIIAYFSNAFEWSFCLFSTSTYKSNLSLAINILNKWLWLSHHFPSLRHTLILVLLHTNSKYWSVTLEILCSHFENFVGALRFGQDGNFQNGCKVPQALRISVLSLYVKGLHTTLYKMEQTVHFSVEQILRFVFAMKVYSSLDSMGCIYR